MSEEENNGETENPKEKGNKGTKVKVKIENEPLERILERLRIEEEKAEGLKKDLDDAMEAKKTAETTLEEEKTKSEDYKNKLQIILEQKFNAKKAVIMDEFKKVIKDDSRLKSIEDGINTADDLKATEFMLETLVKTIETGRTEWESQKFEDNKKTLLKEFPDAKDKIEALEKPEDLETLKKELSGENENNDEEGAGAEGEGETREPVGKGGKGTAPLAGQTNKGVAGYDSYAAMVRDLRRRAHSDNPEEAAEAEAILEELFKRWSVAVKKEYDGKMRGINVEADETQPSLRQITKEGGAAKPKPKKVMPK